MQLVAAPRQLGQLVAQIEVVVRRTVDSFCDAPAAVIVGIRPRLARRLIVLAHELVEAVVGIRRRALVVRDGRDVPARVVGIGIRRRAGFPRPDLPRGRRGRGIVVADRGFQHGLPAALGVQRRHPPQRIVGVARGDGSLRRFRQAVVRSILEYLRVILFSRTDNSHIFTIELKIYKSISLVRLSMQ